MTATSTIAIDPFLQKQGKDKASAYFRRRRFAMIEPLLRQIYQEKGSCSVIDVGGREEYWAPVLPLLAECNVHITVVNLEKTQPKPGHHFDFAHGNACDMPHYPDQSFDLVHSNSLIEHVGRWDDMKRCAGEMRRLGKRYYVQTPYFWFPIEPHFRVPFFHWMPEQLRARLVKNFKVGYFNRAETLDQAMQNVQSAVLLDKLQMAELFPDSNVRFERVAGVPKSLIAIRA
jgi:hypothetical protein